MSGPIVKPAAVKAAALKPLQRPRLWLGLWWLAIAMVVVVCLIPAPDLPTVPHNADKLEHLLAFALLAAAAVQLFATRRALLAVGCGLVLFGIAIELAQGTFTSTRSMDAWDAVADALGVLIGLATIWSPWRGLLLRIDGGVRWSGQA